jgi:BASS family bile acid:Na+ symporter
MTLAGTVSVALTVSLFVLVFVLGTKARFDDLTFLLRHPWLLARSILAMNILLLAVAVAASRVFNLDPAIKIALVTLAVSPVPPLLPGKQISAGGSAHYAIGLLVAGAIVAIFLVPLSIEAMEYAFPFELRIAPSKVLSVVVLSIFTPLVLGTIVARLAPDFARRIAGRLSSAAFAVLVAASVPILIKAWPEFRQLFGNGAVAALVLFTVVGILLGHLLGGPDRRNRMALALACGTRHPGIAIAIASLNFPDEKGVAALIVYHLVIGGLISAPYIRWRNRLMGEPATG